MEPQNHSTNSVKNLALEQKNAPAAPALNVDKKDLSIGTEAVAGKVSEIVGKTASEQTSSGQSGQQQKQQRPVTVSLEVRKAQLLALLPQDEYSATLKMKGDIQAAVDKKISKLESEAKRNLPYYRLNLIVQEIRHLHRILDELVSAAFEYLKNLWLRIVHGLAV